MHVMEKPKAIYPGTFDPPTLAHQSILEQARRAFDVTVVVSFNAAKQSRPPGARAELVRGMSMPSQKVEIARNGESIVDTADRLGARFIIRGIRGPGDFEAEAAYADFIQRTGPSKQVVYFMTPAGYQHISSTAVRSIMALDRWYERRLLDGYVPVPVSEGLKVL